MSERAPAGTLAAPGPTLWAQARDRLEGRLFPYLLVFPTLLAIVLVALIPFGYTVFISLHDTQFTRIEEFTGISNYQELLTDSAFWHSMIVTAIILAVAVPVQLALGLGFALLFHRGVLGSRILSPALLIPSVLAPTVVAIVWKIMLAGTWGFLTFEVIERFDLVPGGSVFSLSSSALAAFIAIDVWQWTPFVTLALFAGLQALPVTPFRAAAVDGASRWHTFRYLTLPMLFPLLAVLLLLRLIDTFKIFDTVFILTGGGPQDSTETISLFLYKAAFDFFEVGQAAAAAVIILIIFFVFASLAYRIFTRHLKLF